MKSRTWSFCALDREKRMSGQEMAKKTRIRADHKASVTRIIAQVKEILGVADWNAAKLKQQLQLLKGKMDPP